VDMFRNCPLNALGPNDGEYGEYSSWNMVNVAMVVQPNGRHLVFRVIANLLMRWSPQFAGARKSMHMGVDDFLILHFRRVIDSVNGAAYDFHRVTLLGEGGASYVYVVSNVVFEEGGGGGEGYHLCCISLPMPNLTPEHSWCSDKKSWFWSRNETAHASERGSASDE
jgi:hypothetical protein